MNAAYRYWDTINWYPTYYSCLDPVVGHSHLDAIARLIRNGQKYGIRAFLLRESVIKELGDTGRASFVVNFDEQQRKKNPFLRSPLFCTGSHSCAWAAMLGYRAIFLLGVDSDYVTPPSETKTIDGSVLEIVETPKHNPNYFFDDYQRKGDKCLIPHYQPHMPSAPHSECWNSVRHSIEKAGCTVVNANPTSAINTFPKCTFPEVFSHLHICRRTTPRTEDHCNI